MPRNSTLHPRGEIGHPAFAVDLPDPTLRASPGAWLALALLAIGLFLYAVPDLAAWLGAAGACR